MKNLIISLLFAVMLVSCGNKQETQEEKLPAGMHAGVIKEKIDTDSYAYLNVEEKGKTYWIAVPAMDIKEGEKVYFSKFMEMKNFHSKTLNRDFESILFVEDAAKTWKTTQGMSTLPEGHPNIKNKKDNEPIKVETPAGFVSVGDLFKNKSDLAGKTVKVKGKVVKYNPNIMGKNWIHIQDGTSFEGKGDILVTSQEKFNVGDVVSVQGTLVADKDFGAGYKYELLIEEGKIIK